MSFEIVRNDITNMRVDAIVNTANPRPVIGSGVDALIHAKAGSRLLQARQRIGRIGAGHAAITPGYDLDAGFVIHTVGPVWRGGFFGEEKLLRSCYDSTLKLALEQGCGSVAFPLISTGNYGFPKDKALQIAISAFSSFLMEHEMRIYLVVFDRTSFTLSEKLFRDVACYIDENYVAEQDRFGTEPLSARNRREMDFAESCVLREEPVFCAMAAPKQAALSLDELLEQTDAGFSETLLKLVDKTGKKDSEIYKKAMISKQHFSKIRNNPDYRPTKPTAIALALALELDLEATRNLIGRAGYALTRSSKFDLIIQFFIEQGIYNIVEINCVLFDHDQSLLGG